MLLLLFDQSLERRVMKVLNIFFHTVLIIVASGRGSRGVCVTNPTSLLGAVKQSAVFDAE